MDVDLAAAEHNMYARDAVAENGVGEAAQLAISTALYDTAKISLGVFGAEDLLSTDGTTPTPGSFEAMGWGFQGIGDGLGDWWNSDEEENVRGVSNTD